MISTNSVFIVEGQNDKALLSRFFNTEIVTTNGSYVSRETIKYIEGLKKHHDIVIITDPDGPGKAIREKLLDTFPEAKVVLIDKNKSIRKGKVGLAETEIAPLIALIMPLLSAEKSLPTKLELRDLIAFAKINPDFKKIISNNYPVGNVNNRTMIKRLHYLRIEKSEIENMLNG